MTELYQAELLRRVATLEARVELLARALAQHTASEPGNGPSEPTNPPTLTGVVCGACGADRLKEGCRRSNQVQCLFIGEAQ